MSEQEIDSDLVDENLANKDKESEDENNVSQVSQDVVSFTQLYSIETIFNKLKNESLTIPDFQRRGGLWSFKNQSLFIESIILQLPIPSIVVFTDASFKLKVIDGLQRTSTLKSFLNNNLELSGLLQSKTEKYNGLKFSELPEDVQNQILNSTLSVITVQCAPSDERANATYYEIFRRLNQGGLTLTPQEIRNALYKGRFLDFLRGNETENTIGIRKNATWIELCKVRGNQALNYARERDVELLLRIFAIAETPDNSIDKKMGDFLNNYLEEANKKSNEDISKIEKAFDKAMNYIIINDLITLFKKSKIRQSMWYNMLLSIVLSFYLRNPDGILPDKDFLKIINRTNLPNSSSDTWNLKKIRDWREIFSEFILP